MAAPFNIFFFIYTDTYHNIDEIYAKWKKPVTKYYILYDLIYMKCPELVNPWRQE